MTQPDPNCLFCKIVANVIPTEKILETERVTAFRDIQPQAPNHCLIIPNTHTVSVSQTEDAMIFGDLLSAARDLAHREGWKDYRLVINNGREAGQTVFHLHLHLLSGRSFDWPPG